MMQRCPECGERGDLGGYCPACGATLDAPPPGDADAPGDDAPARDDAGTETKGGGQPTDSAAPAQVRVAAGRAGEFPDVDAARYLELLDERFGYPEFRAGQREALEALSEGDALAIMPTGAGKSMCFVLPALAGARTLVVSPLIALMQDQVERLQAAGVAAAFINSTVSRAERNRRAAAFRDGEIALLYVAPEALTRERFLGWLSATARVALLVIDEAHCVSEWGHDFRPDYLALNRVRERLGAPRTLAITATADEMVREDIATRLGINDARRVITTFDRPNLRLVAVETRSKARQLEWLQTEMRGRVDASGIIYARSRVRTEEVAAALAAEGHAARAYHAGLGKERRAATQRSFMLDETKVIVATNAFGLGIDKPDVRFVIHLGMPGRLEAYYQEAGRAGRDGEPAECILVHTPSDAGLQRRFIGESYPQAPAVRRAFDAMAAVGAGGGDEGAGGHRRAAVAALGGEEPWPSVLSAFREAGLVGADGAWVAPDGRRPRALEAAIAAIGRRRQFAEARLEEMREYARTERCRRRHVLEYFGEPDVAAQCGNCDNCAEGRAAAAPEMPAGLLREVLEERERIAAAASRPAYTVFEERTAREIAVQRPRDEQELALVWGLGETRVRWFGQRLLRVVRDWEAANPSAPARRGAVAARRAPDGPRETGPEVPFDNPVFAALREWRRARADAEGNPAYTYFTDATGRAIADAKPLTIEDLGRVQGMGDKRLASIGDALLDVVRAATGATTD